MKARKAAKPVPGPTMITGVRRERGGRKVADAGLIHSLTRSSVCSGESDASQLVHRPVRLRLNGVVNETTSIVRCSEWGKSLLALEIENSRACIGRTRSSRYSSDG